MTDGGKGRLDRRRFLLGVGGGALAGRAALSDTTPSLQPLAPASGSGDAMRDLFPRMASEVYLNAAGSTPLGSFAEAGLGRYLDFARLGPGGGRRDWVDEMHSGVRALYAELIGAKASEIALVHCTKAGEQIVLEGLDPLRTGRNVVTNDMHFNGSLHNLLGLRGAGADVRIVRSRNWDVSLGDMTEAIDDETALVSVTLLSNVTGRIEAVRELADIAHAHGALLYADIIQAAGIVPLDVKALGVDFAAANGYKWLYGVHGAGFLYVREELQGTGLPDRLFPGHLTYNYRPWIDEPDPGDEPYGYRPPEDARRYQPGHVSYLGYSAVYEGLRFLANLGVERALEHSLRLNRRLEAALDPESYVRLTPDAERTPILTFGARDVAALKERLRKAQVTVSFGPNYVRVSPGLYNVEEDIDTLAAVLNAAA